MKILIMGCGKTGGAIAENLIDLPYVKKIYLLSKYLDEAKKLENELNSSKVHSTKSINDIDDVDYAIIALSNIPKKEREKTFYKYNNTYDMRRHELKFNFKSIKDIGKELKPHSKKIRYIIVTNPSDEVTNYLQHFLGHKNVFGFGTHLDAKRYSKILKREVLCLGPHGRAFPLINADSEEVYDLLLKESDENIIKHLRKKGIQHKLVGIAFRDFFKKLNSKKAVVHVCSYLKKPFFGVKNMSISAPFEVKNKRITKPKKIKVNEIEKKRFKSFAKELKISVNNLIKGEIII